MSHETYDHEIEVQYRDLDPRKHVNHAVFVSYLEQAKGAFFVDVLDTSLADEHTAIRNLEVDFLAPILPDQHVQVSLGPISVGETSYTIEYEIGTGDDLAAAATTVSVLLDDDGQPRTLPDAWRQNLAPYTPDE
ncbi:MAG: acyl-CoA thioester hydrolase [Haloarculaceae archaeon]|jgi:acyl-CoA thioester hydrolase